ncbi:uncharacterized protein LOC111708427 isoform X2 [Eurytemora carolleeae]|uniref:uncharacterized protein LOC111708427 isoform X2 n=1 Tax=Eurytemora carolleeae TaxID=1294199 RepID=UPI000C77D269|nr:uncharacterized protein LOC111708427 isoform X2 [Eurytemora carolleeae]|eukprot:XP_023337584.1 uncharacterized protein LOC111708427 isoform X2 [Eurytemora affinis]
MVLLLLSTIILSSIFSVSGQLPHTLDLSWFEEVENWGVKDPVPFQFSDYDYFQTRKNEAIYREYWVACEQSPVCWEVQGPSIEHSNCVRQCMSPGCYWDIYGRDELEVGEIDSMISSVSLFKHLSHSRG